METAAQWILHEDRHIVVVNKPAGLATQAPAGIPSVEGSVKEYLRQKYNKPGNVYLGVPQRLDRPVSGVLVLARQTKAARRLHEQFQQRTVEKEYWALVSGRVEPAAGTWHDWLRKVPGQARVERTQADETGARWAETSYRVLAWAEEVTWLALYPRTGRMHQLRVQTAGRGHPILGDTLYGSEHAFGRESREGNCIALHARRLTLRHPFQGDFGQLWTFTAPLPSSWEAFAHLFPLITPGCQHPTGTCLS